MALFVPLGGTSRALNNIFLARPVQNNLQPPNHLREPAIRWIIVRHAEDNQNRVQSNQTLRTSLCTLINPLKMACYVQYFHTSHCMCSLECYCANIVVEYCHLALRPVNWIEQLYAHYKEGKDSWTIYVLWIDCCRVLAPLSVLHTSLLILNDLAKTMHQ